MRTLSFTSYLKYLLIFAISFFMLGEAFGASVAQKLKQKELVRIKTRSKSFYKHKEAQKVRKQKRVRAANKHKKARYEQEFKKKEARRNFKRPKNDFPVKDYWKFISKRDARDANNKKMRKKYSATMHDLKKVKTSRKHKIFKFKEYNLEIKP